MNSISTFFLKYFLQTENIPNLTSPSEENLRSENHSSLVVLTSRPGQGLAELSRGKKAAVANASLGGVTITKSVINFGEVRAGSNNSQSFSINNNSDCKVNVRFSFPSSAFKASVNNFDIPPGGSRSITIFFNPSSYQVSEKQNYLGYMNIYDNQSGNSLGSISLSGTSVQKKK